VVPPAWPEGEAALTVAAVIFNTLVYTRLPPPAPAGCGKMQEHRHSGARPLPASPESGNTDQRIQSLGLCSIGEVRIAQRADSCRTIPMTPLALPDPLVELAGR
jgi:hypothetical protein